MAIGLLAGLLIGFVLGLSFAIWIVRTAGYDWQLILHRFHIEMVYRANREEIDEEIDAEIGELSG